jgi:glutamyl-tRNA reductase
MDGFFCIPTFCAELSWSSLVDLNSIEHVALNTCERNELYAFARSTTSISTTAISTAVLSKTGLRDMPGVELNARILQGRSAAIHLLRVAAGLNSRIVGEPHVLGQVRKAFAEAESQHTAGTMLAALFRAALRTGRRVRAETALNASGESVVSLAMRRLVDELGPMDDLRIGIVGTGTVATDMAHALTKNSVKQLVVFSRSRDRICSTNHWDQSVVQPFADLASLMPQLDGLVACSRVQQPILDAAHFETCGERFAVIDLGSPPNVSELGAGQSNLSLTRLEDLKRVAPVSQVDAAERIVAEELSRLERWFNHRKIAKSIERMVREANLPPQRSTPTLHAKIMRAKAQVAA